MPYVSKKQAAKFHSDPKLKKYAAEWDAATEAAGGFAKLPARAGKRRSVAKAQRKKR